MDEERIERIVEGSKRMQEIGEFLTAEDTDELIDDLATAVANLFLGMQANTELPDEEIASAIAGSVTGIIIGILQYE